MNIVDANVAIVATATTVFLAAYGLPDKKTAQAVSEAFVAKAMEWYEENGKPFDFKTDMLCDGAIVYASACIAKAYEMASVVGKMMSFSK
jgi:hypothetical protein